MAFLVSRWACASCGASFEDKSEAEACERYHVIQGSLALDRISLKNENLTDDKIVELNELFRRTRIGGEGLFDPQGVVNSYERGLADAQLGRGFKGGLGRRRRIYGGVRAWRTVSPTRLRRLRSRLTTGG